MAFSTSKTLAAAKKAVKSKDWLAAVEAYLLVLEHFPKNKKAQTELLAVKPVAVSELLKQAQAFEREKNLTDAVRCATAASTLSPEIEEVGVALASMLTNMSCGAKALRTTTRLLKYHPESVRLLNMKGRALQNLCRLEEAWQVYEQAFVLDETSAITLNNMALLAQARGKNDKGKALFETAMQHHPDSVAIHRNYAFSRVYSKNDAHLEKLKELVADPNIVPEQKGPLYFSLFKALNDAKEDELAFDYLEQGNQLMKSISGYDFRKEATPFALSKTVFPERLQVEPEGAAPKIILVTGLPRSGTTLMERILSCDENVQACGELTVMQLAVEELLKNLTTRKDNNLKVNDLKGLRDILLSEYQEYSDGSPVLVDKMPMNFRWAGYLLAALPEAKVIHMNRDPMAVAWSLLRLSFQGGGQKYVYNENDIAKFMVLHQEWMKYWRALFPEIVDVNYGDLVHDLENTTKLIANGVDLEWSESWLTPEKSKASAFTASKTQVQQPVYKNSDQGWKRYETRLGPLKAALNNVGLFNG